MTALLVGARRPIDPSADDGFEVSYVAGDGAEHRVPLAQAWAAPLEQGMPVRRFRSRKGQRHLSGLDRPHHPGDGGDAVAHWMMFDCWRPPSRPDRTFPDSLHHGAIHPPKVSANSRDRHRRSAQWFARTRRGGGAILHHRHIRPVLIREWSPKMDGIAGTIWASQTTSSTWSPRGNL
jgi:hypothetical protein